MPGFWHKKALCSHHEYPICNCAHSYSLSPCQPLLWNLSIPGSTKQWIAQELHVTSRCAHGGPIANVSARVQSLAAHIRAWKKSVSTLVPSEYRAWTPSRGTTCLFKNQHFQNSLRSANPCRQNMRFEIVLPCWELIQLLLAFFLKTKTYRMQFDPESMNIFSCCIIKPSVNGRNIVGQQFQTLLDVTCCLRLHTLLHVVARC